MAQFAVLIYADDSTHAPDASRADLATADEHAAELEATGSMLIAYALTPRDLAISVRASGVTQGPLIESSELVVGFYVLEADSLDDAVRIARSNPVVRSGGGVEVRPVHSGGVVATD